MRSYIFPIISAAALFVAGVSAQLTINTPTNVLSCTPLQITFSGGTPPYIISISFILSVVASILIHISTFSVHPGATPNGDPLATFSGVTGSPFTWTAVNFASGTSLDLTLRDNTGASAQSAAFTVQSGGSTTCLNGTATGSSAPAASSAAASPSGATATTTGTNAGSTPSKAASNGSGSSGSSTPTSASKNDAIVPGIHYSMAGVLGVVVAAVFA